MKQCPNCESKNITHIVYGYPTDELLEALDADNDVIDGVKTELGGCVIDELSYNWRCNDCEEFWENTSAKLDEEEKDMDEDLINDYKN